jgi:hypothetical protein
MIMATKRNPVAGMGVKELAAKKRAAKNSARKSARSVALIGANPKTRTGSPYVLREKAKPKFLRFAVEMKEKERDTWMPREGFAKLEDAEAMARAWANAYPDLYVRVFDHGK